jgi:uncharacterized protein (TIGR03437 family)
MMKRGLILAALCCLSLRAQFDEMVTTDDGSAFLFRSRWRLAGSDDTTQPKIFRWDAKGFSVLYSAPDSKLISPAYGFDAFLSGDGKISGYGTYPGCSGAACTNLKSGLVLNGATVPAAIALFPPFQVSRDGRFLAAGNTVVNLATGATQTVSGGFAYGGRFGIGNNGGLLMQTLHSMFPVGSTLDLTLSSKPGVVIANSQVISAAVVSASENRVVYEIGLGLWSYDVAAGQSTKIAAFDGNPPVGVSQFQPSISNDGARVLYRRLRSDANVWEAVVQDFKTGTATVIGQILPGSFNLVISGDGKAAWVHRADGRLVRIAIDSLQATEVPGRHAWMAQQEGALVYGSFHHIYGGGFAPDDVSGPPAALTVDLAGLPVPILRASTRELDVQIPWEAPDFGQFALTLHNSSSPFESQLVLDMQGATPTFELNGVPGDPNRSIKAAHQDFHGIVTPSDPALPGEYVHVYMTGVGDVQPRPPTGSPASGLAYATRPLCWLTSPYVTQESAQVAFAGLAPGMIGIYQVDVQIPPDSASSVATLNCVNQGNGRELAGDFGTIYIGKR